MKLRYSEAFYSVQGEGKFVGVPSVFLRTFGCNFRCMNFGLTGEPDRAEPECSAEQDADDANDDLNDRAHDPDRSSGEAVEAGHQAVAWARAVAAPDIDAGAKPHQRGADDR